MPYFLSLENLTINRPIEIVGQEAKHILLAKRGQVGELIKIQGPDERRFLAEILQIKKDRLIVVPKQTLSVPPESENKVTLFQALVAENALDNILQKATELRAAKIILFNSTRVATRLTQERWNSKKDRWNKILTEAAKQSERVSPPALEFILNFDQVAKELQKYQQVFLAEPESKKTFKDVLDDNLNIIKRDSALVIGPEGGLTEEENKFIKALPNSIAINLGPILLRADTAAIAMLSITQNLLN